MFCRCPQSSTAHITACNLVQLQITSTLPSLQSDYLLHEVSSQTIPSSTLAIRHIKVVSETNVLENFSFSNINMKDEAADGNHLLKNAVSHSLRPE